MAATLPISAKELIRFTPRAYHAAAEKPVYLIAAPTLATTPAYDREVMEAGAIRISEEKTRSALRDAVNALLDGDSKEEALKDLDLVAELRDRQASDGAFTDDEKKQLVRLVTRLAELGEWAATRWPPYSELVAQEDYWFRMSRIIAARHFLRGWEGVTESCAACEGSGKAAIAEAPAAEPAACAKCEGSGRTEIIYRAKNGRVDADLLERIPRGDLYDIGFEAMLRRRVDYERRKN